MSLKGTVHSKIHLSSFTHPKSEFTPSIENKRRYFDNFITFIIWQKYYRSQIWTRKCLITNILKIIVLQTKENRTTWGIYLRKVNVKLALCVEHEVVCKIKRDPVKYAKYWKQICMRMRRCSTGWFVWLLCNHLIIKAIMQHRWLLGEKIICS